MWVECRSMTSLEGCNNQLPTTQVIAQYALTNCHSYLQLVLISSFLGKELQTLSILFGNVSNVSWRSTMENVCWINKTMNKQITFALTQVFILSLLCKIRSLKMICMLLIKCHTTSCQVDHHWFFNVLVLKHIQYNGNRIHQYMYIIAL